MANKTIILDLDDTLYCEYDYVRSGFYVVAKYLAEQSGVSQKVIYDKLINYWEKYGRGQVFNLTCAFFHLNKIDIKHLVHIYRQHTPKIELYKDAEDLLTYAGDVNLPLGLITDGATVTQWKKIQALQLEERMNAIVVSDDLGGPNFWKPSEVPYLQAMDRLKKKPEQCMYIGDNPNKDFIAAKALGMETVRVVRQTGDHMKTRLDKVYEADWEISSLTELIDGERSR